MLEVMDHVADTGEKCLYLCKSSTKRIILLCKKGTFRNQYSEDGIERGEVQQNASGSVLSAQLCSEFQAELPGKPS